MTARTDTRKAKPSQRIKGSEKNKKGSAKSIKSAKSIDFSDKVMKGIRNRIQKFRDNNPEFKKIPKKDMINAGKAVVRRAFGAFSNTNRPGTSRVEWGFGRLKEFLKKLKGAKVDKDYNQDDDLIRSLKKKM